MEQLSKRLTTCSWLGADKIMKRLLVESININQIVLVELIIFTSFISDKT